jgi:hypothetical protein
MRFMKKYKLKSNLVLSPKADIFNDSVLILLKQNVLSEHPVSFVFSLKTQDLFYLLDVNGVAMCSLTIINFTSLEFAKKGLPLSNLRKIQADLYKFFSFYTKATRGTYPISNFYKYFIIGLGFKSFKYKSKIHILLGYGHYVIINIPKNVKFLPRKKRAFLLSSDYKTLSNLRYQIKAIRPISMYKPKGFFEYKQFKGRIYIKPGKKKQI